MSYQHDAVRDYINKEYYFLTLKEEFNVKNLFIDLYLPEIAVGFEIQGQQHFERNEFFHKGDDGFYNQLFNDKKKKKETFKSGVKLYYINYNESFDEWKLTVDDAIINGINYTSEVDETIILFEEGKTLILDKETPICPFCRNELYFPKKSTENLLQDECCGWEFHLDLIDPGLKEYLMSKKKSRKKK